MAEHNLALKIHTTITTVQWTMITVQPCRNICSSIFYNIIHNRRVWNCEYHNFSGDKNWITYFTDIKYNWTISNNKPTQQFV